MALVTGTRLGPYEVVAAIGAGGMGEVYQARDTRLDRTVAIKILPAELNADPELRARFEREARTIAALNHPHICTLYDFGQHDGTTYLVMEHLAGETLAQRLRNGALPIPHALEIGAQIAEALDAAHKHGIVHRDLKPANVMLTKTGATLLDFGLAKLRPGGAIRFERDSSAATRTDNVTVAGTLVGTIPYMAPEQVEGRDTDARTDLWALGCVLYEMVTGQRAFAGETPGSLIGAILAKEPEPLATRQPLSPPGLERLITKCLAKDPEQRWDSAHDVADELRWTRETAVRANDSGARVPASHWARWLRRVGAGAGLVTLGAALAVVATRWGQPAPETVPRLANATKVTSPLAVEDFPSWAPDGRTLAYQSDQTGNWDIWVTQEGSTDAVNRTADSPAADVRPSWSPDGRWIAFFSDRESGGYFVMPAVGGPARRLVPWPPGARFPAPPRWSPDSTRIVYALGQEVDPWLEVVTVATGASQAVRLPSQPRNNVVVEVSWSPDGEWLAYGRSLSDWAANSELWLTRLADGKSVRLTDGTSRAWSPTWSDARALYYISDRGGTADLWRQEVHGGQPVGAAHQVTAGVEMTRAAFSADGARLAYAKGRSIQNVFRARLQADRPSTWSDTTQLTFDEASVESVDVSPEGDLLFSSDRAGNWDLWRLPPGGTDLEQLTSDPAIDAGPCWKPGGSEVAFYSSRTGHREIWVLPVVGGPARRVTHGEDEILYPVWAPHGQDIVAKVGGEGLRIVPVGGGPDRRLTTEPTDDDADWSPDGRWVAFESRRQGHLGLWRVPAAGGPAELLTRGDGSVPRWSPDGTQIYFLGSSDLRRGNVWALSLTTRQARPVTALTGRAGQLGLTALAVDQQAVYFTWQDPRGDIWVADVVGGR